MTSLDAILDGLADALELDRELGTRVIEIDRALLKAPETVAPAQPAVPAQPATPRREAMERDVAKPQGVRIAFLHDQPLSPESVTMMAKIVAAMNETADSAPILFTGERPLAQATVVLGARALRKWFPGAVGAPGQWISPGGIKNVLVTYTPEYFLRRGLSPETVQKLKREMWNSLKQVIQRLAVHS